MIKVAAVSDDGETISAHFGRATKYVVVCIERGKVTGREVRSKASHLDFQDEDVVQLKESHTDVKYRPVLEIGLDETWAERRSRGFGKKDELKQRRMFETILDCEIILAGGMGHGIYQEILKRSMHPILTDISNIDEAVQALINDNIESQKDRIH